MPYCMNTARLTVVSFFTSVMMAARQVELYVPNECPALTK